MVDSLYPEDVWFLPDEVEKIGVFVNAEFDDIRKYAKLYQLDVLQLHGQETPELCGQLQHAGYRIIKAFGVGEDFDFTVLEPYHKVVDFFLFDTKTPAHGGSGVAFNWDVLADYPYDIPVLIGGGVSLENLEDLLNFDFPFLYAVDMNSKLELEPGLKDIGKVEEAVRLVKKG